MPFVNLTPHEINIHFDAVYGNSDAGIISVPPSGIVARVESEDAARETIVEWVVDTNHPQGG